MIKNNVDVIAPGTNAVVYTTKANFNNYTGFNGTSAATPHVAGVAGLMLSHVDLPTPGADKLTIEDVENILQMSAADKFDIPASVGYDDYSGWGLLDATAAINKIKKPSYKIQHFGSFFNNFASAITSLDASDMIVTLPNNFKSLTAGKYIVDRYRVTMTFNYNLSSPTDQILAFWPLINFTRGWSKDNPIQTNNWCQIISLTNTQAVLRTYIYNFKFEFNYEPIVDPWFPTEQYPIVNIAAFSIYTVDLATGVNEFTNDNSSLYSFPNPAKNSVTINVSLPHAQKISLELYDAQGKLINTIAKGKVSEGTHQYEVSLKDISEGVYFYRLITDHASYGKKLVVLK